MGAFRQIKVTVTGFGRPTVRTRNGYYATPTAAWIAAILRDAHRRVSSVGQRKRWRVIPVASPHDQILAALHANVDGMIQPVRP